MAGNIVTGVVGTDGFSPIYDEEADWKIWNVHRLWDGPEGPGQDNAGRRLSVPKVDDWAVDPRTTELWIIDHLDPHTLKPTKRYLGMMNGQGGDGYEDWMKIFGVGVGPTLTTYRAFLNTKVLPHTMALDSRWMPRGTTVSYVKVFKGVDTSLETGEVISKVFDATGTLVSTKVALELAAIDSHDNRAFKLTKRFNVTEAYPNDEVVTAVAYSDDGHVVDRQRFLVENTNLIADVSNKLKYITHISLKSIWLSATDSKLLEYPLNNTMDAINLVGVVHYSDGTTLELPVDGSKFTMLGITKPSSIPNEGIPLILRYRIGQNEAAASPQGAANNYIVETYRLKTVNPNHSLEVKVFAYPEWQGPSTGYKLRFFLLNLERNVWFEITQHVRFTQNKGEYDPTLYGYLQKKQIQVNLRDVSNTFIPFMHTQMVDIILNHPPENKVVPDWTIYNQGEGGSRYGVGVYGHIQGSQVIFKGEAGTLEEWLQIYYRHADPLVNDRVEIKAPNPTHFIVTNGSSVTEWPIEAWNQPLAIGGTLAVGRTTMLRFIRRTGSGDLQLAITGVPLKTLQ